jgi:hypothetical protein
LLQRNVEAATKVHQLRYHGAAVLLQSATGVATKSHLGCYHGVAALLPAVAGPATKVHRHCYHGSSALLQARHAAGDAVSGYPATAVADGGATPACTDGNEAARWDAQREKGPLHWQRHDGFSGEATMGFSGDSTTGFSRDYMEGFSGDTTPGGQSGAVLHVRLQESAEEMMLPVTFSVVVVLFFVCGNVDPR